MKMTVKINKKKTVYQGFFTVSEYHLQHTLFSGEMSPDIIRECFHKAPAVGVLAFDPILDRVVLLEQFRIGAKVNGESGWIFEIIAGIIDTQQTANAVAQREALEEAGCELLDMEPVCEYYTSPGATPEIMHLFCAAIDSRGVGGIFGVAEEGEDIRALVVDYQQAIQWLHDGRLNNATTIIAMQWLMLNHERLREKWKDIYQA